MKNIIFCVLLVLVSNYVKAQDTLQVVMNPVITDASYAGGNIEDLYYYVNNNFNYNNVNKDDVPVLSNKQSYFVFYVVFAISKSGKAIDFSPKEITPENSFYKEAVRVIASVRWNPALIDNEYKKQFLVVPIKAMIND